MPRIEVVTTISAPIRRVFNLARSIDLHVASSIRSKEQAIAGRTHGLIELDEEVTWRARHFGVWHCMTNRITVMTEPNCFHDSMVRGLFRRFEHDHLFEDAGDCTTMRDILDFQSPFAIVGMIVDLSVLRPYLQTFIEQRSLYIKNVAESDAWTQFVD